MDGIKYRMAQNKISHQTICNISATSGLVLKILEAASDTFWNLMVHTVCLVHLNYTTTLPCKTITMKITSSIIVLVLKSNANIKIWHFRLSQFANSSKPCENCYLKTCSKCLFPAFTQAQSFDKAQCGSRNVWIVIYRPQKLCPWL